MRADPDPVGEGLDVGPERPAAALLRVAQRDVEVAGQAAVDRGLGGAASPARGRSRFSGRSGPTVAPVAQHGDASRSRACSSAPGSRRPRRDAARSRRRRSSRRSAATRMSSLAQAVMQAMPKIVTPKPAWPSALPQSARGRFAGPAQRPRAGARPARAAPGGDLGERRRAPARRRARRRPARASQRPVCSAQTSAPSATDSASAPQSGCMARSRLPRFQGSSRERPAGSAPAPP